MPNFLKFAALCGAGALLLSGCKKTSDNRLNFSTAINTYYETHPACLWSEAVKFPVQITTSDTAKTSAYDALVDQGLLQRSTAEKKVFIIASKEVTDYDISEQGRSAWTPDPNRPGFGNFCYGHRSVQSIDSSTPTSDERGATTQVTYHSTVTGVPAWASAPETQTAFPQVHADVSGPQVATVTLINTSTGWKMEPMTPSHRPITPADGKIVE